MSALRLRRRGQVWMLLAVVIGIAWVVLWLDVKDTRQVAQQHKKNVTVGLNLPTTIENLQDFAREIPAIDDEAITQELLDYPKEFKDKEFFENNRNKWTVQVMDVAEHRIIDDYLNTRKDKDKFAYFRYSDADNKQRFLLIYGVMNSFQEAMGAAKIVDFKLPKSSRVIPEEMGRYLAMIDNYKRVDGVDMAQVVQLQPATRIVEPKPAKVDLVDDEPVLPADESLTVPKNTHQEQYPSANQEINPNKANKQDKADGKNLSQNNKENKQESSIKEQSKKEQININKGAELAIPPTAKPVAINSLPEAPVFNPNETAQ